MARNPSLLLLFLVLLLIVDVNSLAPTSSAPTYLAPTSSAEEVVHGFFDMAYHMRWLSSVRAIIKTVAIASAGTTFQIIRWEVTHQPDKHEILVIVINGNSPGPLLKVHQGGGVRLYITNSLECSIAIAWEGLQLVESLQCDDATILPGQRCIYHLVAGPPAEYLYQSEYPTQKKDGLWGPIHVLP